MDSSPNNVSDDRFQQLTDRRVNQSGGKFVDMSLVKNKEIPVDRSAMMFYPEHMNDTRIHGANDNIQCNKTAEY